jgi:O-antigen/teichoic acid export membrane protein
VAGPGSPLDGAPPPAAAPPSADRAVRSSRGILALRIVSLGIALVGSIALARSLGPDYRGAHGFLVAATLILAAVFGASASIGDYIMATRNGVDRTVLATNATWFGVVAGLLSMAAMVLVEALFGALPAELAALPLWPLVILVAVAGFVTNGHEGQLAFAAGRSVAGATFSFAPYTVAAIGYAIALVLAPGNLDVAVWTFALAPTLVSVAARGLDRGLGARLGPPDVTAFLGSLRQGSRSYVGELAALLHLRIDVILLGLISGSAAVGIYVVGYQTVEPILALSAASAAAILALGHGDPAVERGDVTVRLVRQTAGLGTIAAVCAFILAPILIPAIYGADFAPAVDPLRILLPGLVGLAIGRIGMAELLRRNMLGRMAAISSMALAINVVLNVLLIPRFGPVGAATASLVSYWSLAAMSLFTVRRESGFPWTSLVPRPLEFVRTIRRGAARGSASPRQ